MCSYYRFGVFTVLYLVTIHVAVKTLRADFVAPYPEILTGIRPLNMCLFHDFSFLDLFNCLPFLDDVFVSLCLDFQIL